MNKAKESATKWERFDARSDTNLGNTPPVSEGLFEFDGGKIKSSFPQKSVRNFAYLLNRVETIIFGDLCYSLGMR